MLGWGVARRLVEQPRHQSKVAAVCRTAARNKNIGWRRIDFSFLIHSKTSLLAEPLKIRMPGRGGVGGGGGTAFIIWRDSCRRKCKAATI